MEGLSRVISEGALRVKRGFEKFLVGFEALPRVPNPVAGATIASTRFNAGRSRPAAGTRNPCRDRRSVRLRPARRGSVDGPVIIVDTIGSGSPPGFLFSVLSLVSSSWLVRGRVAVSLQ